MLGFHDVRDAAFAGLTVDANDRLVRAADVFRVDWQIRHFPRVVVRWERGHAFLHRVLVRTGERRVDEVAYVRVPRMDGQAIAVLRHPAQLVDIGDVQTWIDALRKQIHRQGDHVHITGALTVPKQRALDTICATHQPEFRRCDRTAAIVVRMQAEHDFVAVFHVAVEPLDHVAVHVRRVHFDGGGQIQDQLLVGGRADGIDDRFTDFEREVRLGTREAFGRILIADAGTRDAALQFATPACGVRGDLDDPRFALTEDDAALKLRRRVVEVDDGAWRAPEALEGPLDELFAALRQDLDPDVPGDQVLFDELADEVEIRLRGRRKADLDFLETDPEQHVPEPPLALGFHGIDERLIAVAQVDAAPEGRLYDALICPGAVLQLQRQERLVLAVRHRLRDDWGGGHAANSATSDPSRTCIRQLAGDGEVALEPARATSAIADHDPHPYWPWIGRRVPVDERVRGLSRRGGIRRAQRAERARGGEEAVAERLHRTTGYPLLRVRRGDRSQALHGAHGNGPVRGEIGSSVGRDEEGVHAGIAFRRPRVVVQVDEREPADDLQSASVRSRGAAVGQRVCGGGGLESDHHRDSAARQAFSVRHSRVGRLSEGDDPRVAEIENGGRRSRR